MPNPLVVITIPGLRQSDLQQMTGLRFGNEATTTCRIAHGFPCVTWPSQCNVLTGTTPNQHGVVANGFFWRETGNVEMWTAWNEVIEQPQIWDVLKAQSPNLRTAAWFPMLSKGCGADFVCMPAPIHQPNGNEEMWCYTKPQEFYGTLIERLDHFPLKHFWGPLAGIASSQWIADSAILAAEKFRPDFWYIYLPHLDYAAQKSGPNSPGAIASVNELNGVVNKLIDAFSSIYEQPINWMIVSEYVITDVKHVSFPNRILREAGLLTVQVDNGNEQLDFENSRAWALVDHQLSHVFVKNRDATVIGQVARLFESQTGFQSVLTGDARQQVNLDHTRSGDVVLISSTDSWQAYYWWMDEVKAPPYARTVDIHRKPGYDPVELFFDPATKSIPLDASLVKGSHGAPAIDANTQGLFLANQPGLVDGEVIPDTEIFKLFLKLMQ